MIDALLLSTTALHCCSYPDMSYTGLECVHEQESLWSGVPPTLPTSCCCSCGYGVAVVMGMVTGHYGQYDAFKI